MEATRVPGRGVGVDVETKTQTEGSAAVDPREDARQLRVAFFTDVFPRISNTFILNQITGLLDRGHEVEIFAKAAGDFENNHEVVRRYRLDRRMRHLPIPQNRLARLVSAAKHLSRPVSWHPSTLAALDVRRHGHSAFNLSQLFTTLSFLRDRQFDVVHVQFGKLAPALLPLFRSGALEAPLVVAFRGADLSRSIKHDGRMYDELFEVGDLFLPVSDYFRQRLESLGAPPSRIEVLHSGVDLSHFSFRERVREAGEATRVLYVGRLTEKKGINLVIEAVAKAVTAGRSLVLTVIGEGELEGAARSSATELGIGESVRWLGHRSSEQVAREMMNSHLLIAPSVTAADGDQEGIPNVLKEAMASGLPVLSTDHSGIPELVEDGLSGYLVPERDTTALVEALLELVDHPERWPRMGRAGRAKVERDFDIEPLNDRLLSLYRTLQDSERTLREGTPSVSAAAN